MTSTLPDDRRIDPFRSARDGVYADGVVEVRAAGPGPTRRALHTVRTPHFDVRPHGQVVEVRHRVRPEELDDDLAGLLADELFGPGWLRGPDMFERLFTGVVITMAPTPERAWERFYRNTLDKVAAHLDSGPAEPSRPDPGHGTIADYAPVYHHAETLLAPGSVLELGSCFGFLSLRLAATGRATTASDVASGTVALLARMAPRLGVALQCQVADAARYPAADGHSDNVLVIHLLEHLEPDDGDRVVAEALRLARRRVVIAVPLEREPCETWGHVRTVDLDDLRAWGVGSGLRHEVHEHHGGWLVIDRA